MKRMNFVFVVSDTLRQDHLGVYGNNWISTPYIDRFAKKSLIFENAYTGSFPTVPNRHDVMVGRFTGTYWSWAPLPADELVLAQILSSNDYITMMIVDQPHILENGFFFNRGFTGWNWIRGQETDNLCAIADDYDVRCDSRRIRLHGRIPHFLARRYWRYEEDRFVVRTAQSAMKWLEDYVRIPAHNRKPFFLYVDTFDPHEPWDAPEWFARRYYPDYGGEVIDYPHCWFTDGYLSDDELRYCQALYAGEVTLVDRWIGRFLEKLEDIGLMENTIVFFTSDHGYLLGEYGIIGKVLLSPDAYSTYFAYIPLFDEIAHIPLIVRTPEERIGRVSAIVQPADFAPTILELAGINIPETMSGKSFARVIEGDAETHRTVAYSFPYLRELNGVTVRWGNYLAYIRPKKETGITKISLAVDGRAKKQWELDKLSKDVLLEWRKAFPYADDDKLQEYIDKFQAIVLSEHLYDVSEDKRLEHNLAGQEKELMREIEMKVAGFLQTEFSSKEVLELWVE